MKRKCDRCSAEATVHEVMIRNGEKVEKHLCEACAREEGVAVASHAPINELITSFVMSQAGAQPAAKPGACAGCGMNFAEFRQSGLLGCSECYKAFEPQLGPMIERAHEGATHHTGKTPRRGVGAVDRQERIVVLRRQLSEAIAAEQYERAAALRDELLHVEKSPDGAGDQPPAKGGR
ncbi:MAG: UvrB/UvrC motif-containing protein [Planctomycetota bacterium]|nr:UvrB/UvrC motif-containing protein [Planctomycetota bacterium]